MAGLVIGIQYLTTLLSRPLTSSLCDRLGSKLSVICGLLACALSGLLTLVAPLQNHAATGLALLLVGRVLLGVAQDRKSTRLNSSHVKISYAVFCLKKKK